MKLGKFLTAVSLGAVAGLLLAPKKGKDLREDLKEKSKETYYKVRGMTREDLEAIIGETIDNVKKSVDEFDSDEFKATTKAKMEDLQVKLQDLATKVKDSEQYEKVVAGVEEVTKKLNDRLDDVKKKVQDGVLPDPDIIEDEIDDVEEELDEIIDKIN